MKDHEQIRKELWINIYIAYVGDANAVNQNGGKNWADIALKEFDERFKSNDNETKNS